MRRFGYGAVFSATLLLLATGAVYAFGRLGLDNAPTLIPDASSAQGAEAIEPRVTVRPAVAAYARFADEDLAWREQHARAYTLAELRARGDGRRTARQAMQDRVYAHVRSGRRALAIAELERWTGSHREDREAILWLARLLNEDGRTDASLARYRQVLRIEEGR